MKFEEFLQFGLAKIGPQMTFDMAKGAKYSGLVNLLVSKNLITQEELEEFTEIEFNKSAQNVLKMINSPGSPFKQS